MSNLTTPTAEQMLHFQAWRADALQIMPYMASIAFSLRPVNTTMVDTFAVDPGHRLYINFENTISKGKRFCAEGLLHECSHLLAEHAMLAETGGVKDDERKAWNMAGDFAINDDLRDAGCDALAAHGVFAKIIGEDDYKSPLYYMDVLRRLQKAAKNKPKPQPQPGEGGAGEQDDSGDQPDDGGDGGGESGQDQTPMRGCGSGAGGQKGNFELDDDDSLGGKAEAASGVEKNLVRIAAASAVRQHQEQKGIGSVPGGIAEIVDRILTPTKTPWERVLASYVRRCVAYKSGHHDTSYQRRNRRRMNEEMCDRAGNVLGRVIAPGYIKPIPSLHFYRDTSGTMSENDMSLASSQVIAIARKLGIRGNDLMVSDIDTDVAHTRKFTGAASLDEVHGRGGTDMGRAIEHACDLRRKPSAIVIATDGETGWPQEPPSVPVIVLLVNLRSDFWRENVPAWAHVVEVENHE
ncbi:vWA domain-containing protein [Arthrobacter sp. H14]|uniref:vWA domain-containing protein n=1 Tax=Arthrobacter sp. H14 TaxID=1312959 RepID=UPI00047CE676|nr:VWA-like domain-containing protein [Arthrobacter sp. H14]